MRKLKWKKGDFDSRDSYAFLNGVCLGCCYYLSLDKWLSHIVLGANDRAGLWFDSLEEAQEDCVQLAQRILLEYHECLVETMKSFDLEVE